MSEEIGEVIASRTVADGDRPVLIEFGAPTPSGDGFRCGFRIEGVRTSSASGTDALAALYSALTEVGAELERANAAGANFTVFGQSDLGFPVASSGSGVSR
ncbi:DUF6968 family protein [Nocardia sp. IBHARD005]|uniref:DUF6968 family protein n=1 Tax=Nocardia sp. IBHARD005 TaxID=3457765 RepID=UPI00405A3127